MARVRAVLASVTWKSLRCQSPAIPDTSCSLCAPCALCGRQWTRLLWTRWRRYPALSNGIYTAALSNGIYNGAPRRRVI